MKKTKLTIAISSFVLCLCLACAAVWLSERASSGDRINSRSARLNGQSESLISDRATIKLDTQDALDFIEFPTPRIGWIGSRQGLFYKTTDGGATWQRAGVKLPFNGRVNSVHFASESVGWLILQRYPDAPDAPEGHEAWLLHTNDGGQNWQVQFTAKSLELVRMDFAGEREGWVIGNSVGQQRNPGGSGIFLLHSVDGGKSWIDVSTDLNRYVDGDKSGSVDAARDIAATGSQAATVLLQSGLVINTRDGGQQWLRAGSLAPGMMNTRIVAATNHLTQILGGQDGQHGIASFFAQGNDQETWTENILAGVYLKDAAYLSSVGVVACGALAPDNQSVAGRQRREGVILRTDDGLNWSVVYRSADMQSINALAFDGSGRIWGVGSEGRVLRLDIS